jgi:tetratricopeptide (TPR) repeat protein
MRSLAALAFAAVTLGAASASAQPSIWEAARDPESVKEYQTLVAVERMMSRSADDELDPFLQRDFQHAAIAMMELTGGERMRDERLGFVLGDLLTDSSVGRDEAAKRLLERALARAPDSPLAGRGWFNLAIVSARLGQPTDERRAYTLSLERIYEPAFRANIFMNRGESNMVLGEMDKAIADYRRAIKLADSPQLQALAYYGLGITLERRGDLPSALDAMRQARASFAPALDAPSVFFVPSYDLYYYKALGEMSAARDAKKKRDVALHLFAALDHWESYLKEAELGQHRWVPNAKRHQAAIEKRLKPLLPELKAVLREQEKPALPRVKRRGGAAVPPVP